MPHEVTRSSSGQDREQCKALDFPIACDSSFQVTMAGLQTHDPDSATRIYRRFAHRLIALAQTRLNPQLRAKVDPEDVAQSALKSFFIRYVDRTSEFDNWDSLWRLLALITVRKCAGHTERLHAGRRDVGREVQHRAGLGGSVSPCEPFSREPTPSEAAICSEALQRFMSRLNEQEQRVFCLHLDGHTVPEISVRIGRTERTVRRLLEQAKMLLEDLLERE